MCVCGLCQFWGGVFWNWKVTKCQDLLKVEFSLCVCVWGGYSATEKSQSANICLKLNFPWGGGYSETEKSQSANICLKLNFPLGGEGGVFWNWKVTKCQHLLKVEFSWGGGILKLSWRIGVFCRIWTKFSTTPAGSCITDSLSHTTYVETNNRYLHSIMHGVILKLIVNSSLNSYPQIVLRQKDS